MEKVRASQTAENKHESITSSWDKFCLLMWKNSLLLWRHKIQTVIEIIVPIILCLGMIGLRSLVVPVEMKNSTFYEPINLRDVILPKLINSTNRIVYSPISELSGNLIYRAIRIYINEYVPRKFFISKLFQVDTAENIIEFMEDYPPSFMINGMHFEAFENLSDYFKMPKNVKYTTYFSSETQFSSEKNQSYFYNWQTNLLFPVYSNGAPRQPTRKDGGLPLYIQEGFAVIQHAIAVSISRLFCFATADCDWEGNAELPELFLKRFPYPPYISDDLSESLQIFVPFCIMLSVIYPTMNTVRFIVNDKERPLRNAMRMMGIPDWMQWLSWFVRTIILLTVIFSFMVALMKIPPIHGSVSVFKRSDWSTIWMFLFVYSISVTTYCFMLSVFFSKANSAAIAAGLIWLISYVPISLIHHKSSEKMSIASKIIACLCSNTEMAYGFELILRFEVTWEGLQWSKLMKPVTVNDDISVGITVLFVLMTSLIYLLVALYVEKICPGSTGVPEKWYFPLTKKFWRPGSDLHKTKDNSEMPIENIVNDNLLNFEADPENRRAVVRIENLRKVSQTKSEDSRGLSLNMFEDQVTVLLGHNGAGKTTAIAMLTGMFPLASGNAIINGYNIRENLQEARNCIGLCSQNNILFDELTVREHIIFYSRLKGMSRKDALLEVKKYVELLELQPKMNTLSRNLTRGMQRKLLVGIALCAHSKVVFLDEPSNGMDPTDRRVLWNVLESEKKGRTILLATNFVNEADVVGDRIAFIVNGEVKSCGTSSFLKKRFSVNHQLICLKEVDCRTGGVTRSLRNSCPRLKLKSDIKSKITYVMPRGQEFRFPRILKHLEADRTKLKLSSFGIWESTLEDIFLKVCSDSTKLDKISDASNVQKRNTPIFNDALPLLGGIRLEFNQWHAMLKKKYIFWYRHWILYTFPFLIPVAFVVISVVVFHIVDIDLDLKPLPLTLDPYEKSVTMLQYEKYNSSAPGDTSLKGSANYSSILRHYREMIQERYSQHTVDEFDEDIETRFLRLAQTNLIDVNSQYLVGMSPGKMNNTLIAWFNNEALHSVPLTISLIWNALFRAKYGTNHNLTVTYKPVRFSLKSKIDVLESASNLGFQLATFISFAMAFVSTFYAIFYIKERVSNIKQLQFTSGVGILTFWLASFLFDYITYILTVIVTISTIFLFQENGWSTVDELLPALIILAVFGFAILPVTYVLSWCFSNPSNAFAGLTIIYLSTGSILFFVIEILKLPIVQFIIDTSTFRDYLVIFPHYSLSRSLKNLNFMNTVKHLCQVKCNQMEVCDLEILCSEEEEHCCGAHDRNYYEWDEPGILRNLACMVANGIIFFIILLLVEYSRLYCNVIYCIQSLPSRFTKQSEPQSEKKFVDTDVLKEKQEVDAMSSTDLKVNNLVLRNLSKCYGNSLVVNQVSIGIKQCECFGLICVDGAGKTTFQMLTGDTRISRGDAFVCGISLKSKMKKARKIIGYCPQFDALFEELTGRETLEIFALLRGVRMNHMKALINRSANDLNFIQHIDQRISEYSSANKRKLCVAIALIGNPTVVFLHEPTTGMDPDSTQTLYDTILKVCQSGKSVVLASNNIEDYEAVCNRVAIMVNGKLMGLGSTQDLKNKSGVLLTLKVRAQHQEPSDFKTNTLKVKVFMGSNFPTSVLKKENGNLLTYCMPQEQALNMSTVASLLHDLRKKHVIEDYLFSKTSLDQVLLPFIT